MTTFKSLSVPLSLVFVGGVYMACGGSNGGGGGGGTSSADLATADSIDDLNLGGFNLNIPDSLTNNSSSLALGGASREACEVSRLLGDGLKNLELAGSLFCHLEVESKNIKFGTKYNLEFTDGDVDPLGLWVDNSKIANGQLQVSLCSGNQLAQVVTISGLSGDAVKGSIIDRGSEDGQSWAGSISFDLGYTTVGQSKVYAAQEYSQANESFKQMISINLQPAGVSSLSVSEAGTWQSYTFNNAGTAKVGSEYGQVLFTSTSSQYPQYPWTRRAYFDLDGNVVDASITADFSSGGSLYVANSDVPAALDSSFSAANFAADAWDCSTEETLTIDMSGENGAAHDSCDDKMNEYYEDCYNGYEDGEEEAEFDDSERVDADNLNDMD